MKLPIIREGFIMNDFTASLLFFITLLFVLFLVVFLIVPPVFGLMSKAIIGSKNFLWLLKHRTILDTVFGIDVVKLADRRSQQVDRRDQQVECRDQQVDRRDQQVDRRH